jgi:hypothetical protein
MKPADRRTLDSAGDDSVTKIRAARSATNEAGAAIARGAVAGELQPLLDRVTATHDAALSSARDFAAALATAKVESIALSTKLAVAKVEAAKTAADQLKSAPAQAEANTTREADDEAVTQLADLKAAFQNAPESEQDRAFALSDLLSWVTELNPQQVLGLIAGAGIFFLAVIGVVVLGLGIFGPQSIVGELADTSKARGLITYIMAVGTMAISLVLVISVLIGGQGAKENFALGKEILAILMGVFGTILGFYFGSEKPANEKPTTEKQAAVTPSATPTTTVTPVAAATSSVAASPTVGTSPTVAATPTVAP